MSLGCLAMSTGCSIKVCAGGEGDRECWKKVAAEGTAAKSATPATKVFREVLSCVLSERTEIQEE